MAENENAVRETATPYASKPATYQDVLDAPEHMVAELIDGALHLQPRPRPRHSRATARIHGQIDGPFDIDGDDADGPGGWVFFIEPELHLGEDALVPDLAGWRAARAPQDPDEVGVTIAPDWVCEVLSPSTKRLDETRKSDLYAAAGVGHLWLVDPVARLLTAFENTDGRWTRLGAWAEDAAPRVAPFDAIALRLAGLWMGPSATEGGA